MVRVLALIACLFWLSAAYAQDTPQGNSGADIPSGPAGGSLAGTYPNPTLASINSIATSLAIGGATIGSNALAVTGSSALGNTTIGAGSAITSSGAGGALGTGAFAAAYTLPAATSSTLGGVKPDGTTICNATGAISLCPPYAFLALITTGQTVTVTKIAFNSVVKDNDSYWDATNHRYTPGLAGTYLVTCKIDLSSSTTLTEEGAEVYKNGAEYALSVQRVPLTTNNMGTSVTAMVPLNGSTDYAECWSAAAGTGTITANAGAAPYITYMLVQWVAP